MTVKVDLAGSCEGTFRSSFGELLSLRTRCDQSIRFRIAPFTRFRRVLPSTLCAHIPAGRPLQIAPVFAGSSSFVSSTSPSPVLDRYLVDPTDMQLSSRVERELLKSLRRQDGVCPAPSSDRERKELLVGTRLRFVVVGPHGERPCGPSPDRRSGEEQHVVSVSRESLDELDRKGHRQSVALVCKPCQCGREARAVTASRHYVSVYGRCRIAKVSSFG